MASPCIEVERLLSSKTVMLNGHGPLAQVAVSGVMDRQSLP
jgi:hypothetical protein